MWSGDESRTMGSLTLPDSIAEVPSVWLVWLVCEASIPTCACFPSENFL